MLETLKSSRCINIWTEHKKVDNKIVKDRIFCKKYTILTLPVVLG